MDHYDIHPDFLKYRNVKPPINRVALPILNFFLTRALYRTPMPQSLTEQVHTIHGYRGKPVRVSVLSPTGRDQPLPALVYFHGGAFALQAASYLKRLAATYALETPCTVVFVDYHLLPRATFPAGLKDCLAAYRWTLRNADLLGIDRDRIAIGGDSAGGALAIGVSLLARDRQLPMPCFQLLIYPVTDARQETPSMRRFTDTPLWNAPLNAAMWRMYLRRCPIKMRQYASPAQAASLGSLPPTYVEVAEFDCLRDEGIAFARALRLGGVPVRLEQVRRAVHGFEIAEKSEIVAHSVARRVRELRAAFAKPAARAEA